jgi:cytochrome c-type biogenesis protein
MFVRLAGIVVIFFGLHTMGWIRIEWLYYEKRVHSLRTPVGFVGTMLVGTAFAFGWTPCVGPVLAGIMTLAGSRDSVRTGVELLLVYSLGLGLPFLLAALAINRFLTALATFRRYFHTVELIAGSLLVSIGVFIFIGKLSSMSGWLSPLWPLP